MRPATKHLVLLSGCAAAITVLSLAPAPSIPSAGIPGGDKVEHAVAYAVLAALAVKALSPVSRSRRIVGSVILCTAYGILMEIAQAKLTTTRTAEVGDVVADAAGAVLAVTLRAFAERKRHA